MAEKFILTGNREDRIQKTGDRMKTGRMEAWNDGRKEKLCSDRIYRIFRIIVFEI